MIFADASALVAIIGREPDHASLSRAIDGDPDIACSAVSVWETVAALVYSYRFEALTAQMTVAD